jgi:hypothetical protein
MTLYGEVSTVALGFCNTYPETVLLPVKMASMDVHSSMSSRIQIPSKGKKLTKLRSMLQTNAERYTEHDVFVCFIMLNTEEIHSDLRILDKRI